MISDESLGRHFTAYYGGRTECRIRGVPLPVRYLDVTSMYPTVFSLLRLWSYVVGARLVEVDATEEARRYLSTITRETLHDASAWPDLACTICRIQPSGELVPVRAKYGGDPAAGAWTIGLNELVSGVDCWYTLADLVACKLLTGRVPEVLEARRVVPKGIQKNLRRVSLAGAIDVDPARDDFFRTVIETRKRVERDPRRPEHERRRLDRFLKVLANSTSYGLFAEVRVGEPERGGTRVKAYGLEALDAKVRTREEPGLFCLPPLAAAITGAARLLLALIEADLAAMGGTYVGCDTDSLFIVGSSEGGFVPCPGGTYRTEDGREAVLALSDGQIDQLIAGIDQLNPYARDAVPSLLKLEKENFATDGSGRRVELRGLQLSSKRYALYERHGDDIALRKASEHGFGLYRSPIPRGEVKWHEHVWRRFVREAEGLADDPEPDWFERPAVSQLPVTTPALLAPFRRINEGKPYNDQVKPFNFLLIGRADRLAPLPTGFEEVTPVAPYTSEPERYLHQTWVNRQDGRLLAVTTKPGGEREKVRLKTYGDIVREYRAHPELKSGDLTGGLGTRSSVGLLPRLRVMATEVRHIGKESNRLDEVEEGLISDPDEVYIEYRDDRREWERERHDLLRMAQDKGGILKLAREAGMSVRTLRSNLNTARVPRAAHRALLSRLLADRNLFTVRREGENGVVVGPPES